uniref:Uncharacterized protein n=1 Tax=Myoviridae sp. ctPkm1 TaxID=2825099 RepID=A0A8S5TYA9_9CAUD|nr:MAG TPA: hypothetical protein [Myoviridae sp. ctPkm1]
MAILDLQMAEGSSPCGVGALMYERDDASHPSGHDLRFAFTTEFGSDVQESFTVRVSAKGYAKGMSYESQWKDYEATVDASKCNERRSYSGGRVSWSIPLSLVGSLTTDFGGGKWTYAGRAYDTATFEVSVRANWKDDLLGVGGDKSDWVSEWAYAELYMGFLANYSLTQAYYESADLLVIEYATTWMRQDDRFAIDVDSHVVATADGGDDEGIILLGGGSSRILSQEYWDTVAAPGRIEVPVSALTQHLRGKTVWFDVAFNPVYRPYAIARRGIAQAELPVGDKSECNSCTLAVVPSEDPYAVWLKTGDAGDLDSPITEVSVKCRTSTGYSSQVKVKVGEVAKMRGCPLNSPLLFEGVGGNGYSVSKKVTTVAADPIRAMGVCVVDSASSDSRAVIRFNQKYRVTSEPDGDTMKLAGRDRPSSFYGQGGATKVEVSGVLVDEDGTDVENMVREGDVYVRLPDGRAYRCKASATIDWDFRRLRNVSLSGEEVAP